MYSPQLLDHFEHPRNAGTVAAPDASVKLENPACGDVLELSVRLDAGWVAQIRFRAQGCVAAMACASAMTELVQGKPVEHARQLRREEIIKAVGGLPEASAHASHLAIDALQQLLKAAGG